LVHIILRLRNEGNSVKGCHPSVGSCKADERLNQCTGGNNRFGLAPVTELGAGGSSPPSCHAGMHRRDDQVLRRDCMVDGNNLRLAADKNQSSSGNF
jgi:hypothetical protein